MELQIKPLKKQDYSKAIQFAIRGMNFDRYMENKTVLDLYGRYFWYMSGKIPTPPGSRAKRRN